jgi:hypothetical protein
VDKHRALHSGQYLRQYFASGNASHLLIAKVIELFPAALVHLALDHFRSDKAFKQLS